MLNPLRRGANAAPASPAPVSDADRVAALRAQREALASRLAAIETEHGQLTTRRAARIADWTHPGVSDADDEAPRIHALRTEREGVQDAHGLVVGQLEQLQQELADAARVSALATTEAECQRCVEAVEAARDVNAAVLREFLATRLPAALAAFRTALAASHAAHHANGLARQALGQPAPAAWQAEPFRSIPETTAFRQLEALMRMDAFRN